MTSLYEILEVETTATPSEIKKAYRKLALRYHPDKVTEEDREFAESKFKEISHAYEILIDEGKKEHYDTYGTTDQNGGAPGDFAGNPFDNFYGGGAGGEYGADDFYNFFNNMNGGGPSHSRQRPPNKTEDAEIDVEVTLEDLFKGKVIRTTSTRNIICTHCKGSGAKKSAVLKKCGVCEGEGHVRKIRRVGPGLVTQEYVTCSTCEGTGSIYRTKDRCKKCTGTKVIEETKILEFDIVKGSKSGDTIVLPKESDQFPGKETGDVKLTFTCKDHAVFTRKGDDLYAKFKIPLFDALCGFSQVVVKHLDGRGIKISTPPGKVIRPGDYIKIKNEGMPVKDAPKSWFGGSGAKRGDLYIEVDIEFPRDNWYLEKNDILKMKNLLPNELQSKHDIKKQTIDGDSLPEANIDTITEFTIAKADALPDYAEDKPAPEYNDDHYHEDAYGSAQPECQQQ
ncbi:DnaJ-domain-containing protein [Suhomyces tanzawaensis NRRL Y-17324]|uniref:DnaJ-domain-containing protein n=1 Tax=Suhomyces tanzawaensis NRRL Y-17324 TaxID=984487 RepID=A0A1E4SPY2_9ASCO|nr:DnaJ-domain-containing protein [Suhomyces tanzawaensis NRRL Y-17324]ODV81574.1 DnaJ-domain-containing protein [Suhomyces tanzawaensis NRRL Y-17324]